MLEMREGISAPTYGAARTGPGGVRSRNGASGPPLIDEADQIDEVARPQFLHDPGLVDLYRSWADTQFLGDKAVVQALDHQGHDFPLAWRKPA